MDAGRGKILGRFLKPPPDGTTWTLTKAWTRYVKLLSLYFHRSHIHAVLSPHKHACVCTSHLTALHARLNCSRSRIRRFRHFNFIDKLLVIIEVVEGKREEIYWHKVPDKVKRQAVEKVILALSGGTGGDGGKEETERGWEEEKEEAETLTKEFKRVLET